MTTLQPGNVVGGRWRIASAVPSSTGRELYLAVDATSGGEVTLELHPADALANPAAWAEYQRQAQAIAALPLEAIARLYDANVEPALARAYTVGERIGWPSLASRVASAPLPPLVAYATLEAVGHALEAANAAGFVHRELDASQVFVDPDNPARVRVTGFAAWVLHAAAPPASGWIGSPGWVAPEGVSPGAAVARTMDVYSLAALAFYALTGQLPFRALRAPSPEPGALWAELTSPFGQASQRAGELGRGLAPSLDPWFARALAPEPHARFPSVAEALTALGDAMSPGAPAQPGLKRTLLFGVDGGLAPAAPPPIAPAPAAPPPIAPPPVAPPPIALPAPPPPAPERLPPAGGAAPIALASVQPLAHMERMPGAAEPRRALGGTQILEPGEAAATRAAFSAAQAPPGAPVAMAGGPAMPLAAFAPAVDSEPVELPKSRAPVALIAIGALALLGGAAVAAWLLLFRGPSEDARATSPSAAASSPGAPAPAASGTPSGTAASAASAETAPGPAPAASGELAANTPGAAEKPTVTFRCTPSCEWIECEKQKIAPDTPVALSPGKHECTAGARGFVPVEDTFTLAEGDRLTRDLTLERLPAKPTAKPIAKPTAKPTAKPPCGTFINPCK